MVRPIIIAIQRPKAFSATGVAGVLGVNTIHLQGSGRPIAPAVDVFTVTFDTSHCQINIVVTGAGGGGGGSFGGTITAIIDGATTPTTFNFGDTAVVDNTSFPGYTILDISGAASATSNETIDIGIAVPGASLPAPGTYDVSGTGLTYFLAGDYLDPVLTDYSAITTGTNPTPTFTVTITSITATRVQGTFTGALWENGSGPATKTFTSGTFDVPR